MDKNPVSLSKSSFKSFTLVELIIVVIIVGILASLGLTQYNLMVEKSRLTEAFVNMGKMRVDIISYYMENGTLATITDADVGIGTPDGLPFNGVGCVSTNYFTYALAYQSVDLVSIYCYRCGTGVSGTGKPPQWTGAHYAPWKRINSSGNVVGRGCYNWSTSANDLWCTPP